MGQGAMSDQKSVLGEDDVLGILRAIGTGAEPPMRDVTGSAIRAGRRRRLRRQGGRVGAGLVLAGAAALVFTVATPGLELDGRSVVVPADGAPDSPPTVTPGPDDATAHATNLRVLRAALGPEFQRENPQAKPPFHDSLVLVPDSKAARALPPGYGARAHVSVSAGSDGASCDPKGPADDTGDTCQTRQLADGREIVIGAGRNPLEASVPVEIHHVSLTQPDGDVVSVSLAVLPDTVRSFTEKVPRAAIKAWLAPFENALVAAATDPEIAPGSVRERERAAQAADGSVEAANLRVLAESLGSDFDPIDGSLELVPGTAAAAGLPADYQGRAIVLVDTSTLPLREECPTPRSDLPVTCQPRTLADGREVLVISSPVEYRDNSLGYAEITVIFIQNTGYVVAATVTALAENASPNEPAGVRRQVADWLATFEDRLIAAATDPRMAGE